MKNLAVLFAYGPEVRAFVHSGLLDALSERYSVTCVTANPSSDAFRTLDRKCVCGLPSEGQNRTTRHLRSVVVAAHDAWLQRQGRTRWKHYLPVHQRRPETGLLRRAALGAVGMMGPIRAIAALEQAVARRVATDAGWAKLLTERSIDCVLVAHHSSARTLPALQTAIRLRIPTAVLMNSWKDVYSQPYVHVPPTRMGVWSEAVARDLLEANPHVRASTVAVTGSLHLEPFRNHRNLLERGEFCSVAGLDPKRPFVCYTAAAPAAIRNEELVVDRLARGLHGHGVQVLLRPNPMETGDRFVGVVQRHENLVVGRPDWEWDATLDWCCARDSDTRRWVSTVFHAAGNVSVASTVTNEFAAAGRPVVNVCFDLPEAVSPRESARRFWEAEFYAEAREQRRSTPVWSVEEMLTEVQRMLRSSTFPSGSPEAVPSAVENAIRMIDEATA